MVTQVTVNFWAHVTTLENFEGYDRIAQYYFCPGDYDSEVDGEGSEADSD